MSVADHKNRDYIPMVFNIDSRITNFKLFEYISLLVPAEILGMIGTPETLKQILKSYDAQNARTYYLSHCLAEVQQAGFAFERWNALALKCAGEPAGRAMMAELSSIIVDINAWLRKLTEILARIICFADTNSCIYYYHYLLCEDLCRTLHDLKEQRDLFDFESSILTRRHSDLLRSLKIVEQSTEFRIDECWYLAECTPLSSRKQVKGGGVLCSLKTIINKALKKANASEKTALGYLYQYAFSQSSEVLHFVPLPSSADRDIRRFSADISRVSLLSISISARCQNMLGIFPEQSASQKVLQLGRDGQNAQNPFIGNAELGDFVVVELLSEPFLAEVIEIKKNNMGYLAYKVSFLCELPCENIGTDWISANHCAIFIKRTDLERQFHERLLDPSLSAINSEMSIYANDRQIVSKSFRMAVIEVWNTANIREQMISYADRESADQNSDT